jgi:hypothetical protein
MNSKKITNMALTAIILISSPFAYTQTLEEVIVTGSDKGAKPSRCSNLSVSYRWGSN